MDASTVKTVTEYIDRVREKYADFEGAYVFGSYARGNYNADSDIDLALIFKSLSDAQRFDVQVQLILLASRIDNRIEPHPISHEDFYSQNPFAVEIKRTGKKMTAGSV
jgi:uncharacterized protein